ncbi:hypothetical protein [Flavobacterium sp.]|uniref:hypothetical protein n=1 Tax=Flavobacterium sp. TaxID=239 RepID=UPI0037516676
MKIEYKILWLDDKIQDFIDDELILEIEEHLMNEGFNPLIITCSKIEDFYSNLNNSYDLILTDFHLTETLNGDKVVEEIRKPENAIFTEILFYTAQADLKDTDKISRITFLETNKKVGRHSEILVSEIIALINLTIRKFQHIVNMRGMIMHETSSLDAQMLEIINSSFTNENINLLELSNSIYDQLNELFDRKNEVVNQCREKASFKNLTKDNFIFSSDYKIQTLKKIIESFDDIQDFSDDYKESINSIRNKFAHAILEEDENGRKYFKYKEEGINFDENLCKDIRKKIILHKKNLDNLQSKF